MITSLSRCEISRAARGLAAALILSLSAPGSQARPEAFEVSPELKDHLPRGKEADGIIGDFILRNNQIEVVISGNLPLRRANMSTFYGTNGITPGCLYDLTLKNDQNDQITIFAPCSQQGPVSWVRVQKDGQDGEAVIETVITAAANNGLARRHEYRLQNDWQGLLITTTLHNQSEKLHEITTDDRWTSFLRTNQLGPILWADAVNPADKAGYACAVVEGGERLRPGKKLELRPSESVTFTRFLAVGRSPAEAVGLVASRLGSGGHVKGDVRDKGGAPVSSAQLLIRQAGETVITNCLAYPDNEGRFSFGLPPGQYEIEVMDTGRGSLRKPVTVSAGQETNLHYRLPELSRVEFDIRDESGQGMPCKVQFHGIEGTPSPNLGPPNRAHGCVDQYHSEKGRFTVPLPPGQYRIVVTRGIEYSHLQRTLKLEPEQSVLVEGQLKRLVDTTGWVSADYHNHSTPSGDNTCGTDDRLINLAAEHIEFAPTTEHNRLYDWRPHIERLGLTAHLQTVPGIELTGSGPHLNSFPFRPEPLTQDNGAPVWHKDPRISAVLLRDWQGAEPDRWIQINHPDMVHNFLDRDEDGRVEGGFAGLAELIDGIETQNYRGSEILGGRPYRVATDDKGKESVAYVREFIWLQMLNRGHRYAAMAVNDAHSVYGNGVGGWRMYMPSRSELPSEIDWRENSRHAKSGRSILTSGPFLQVQTDDNVLPGGTARGSGGVTLRIKVQCTDWISVDRVQILVNGRQEPTLNFTRASHPTWFGRGVIQVDQTVRVPLTEDAHLIVVACSESQDLSVGYGTSTQARMRPYAYNNPIFVDVDGHGFRPNGDTLGFGLPVKKLTVNEVKRAVYP